MDKKARILIVDDDLYLRNMLKDILFKEGYELTLASNGAEALKLVKSVKPETLLLDVIMPDIDGFEVCRQIKADKDLQNIPIIMITGLNTTEDLSRGLNAGADDFLHKPLNILEMRSRVNSMLRIKRQFDELEETMLLKEDLSNMIIHDMKNPLSAIMMASQLLQVNVKTPPELKFIDTIQSQARYLESIMNDVLVLAKMKEGKLILNQQNININHFVQELVNGYNAIVPSRGIDFVIDLPEKSEEVSIDKNLFKRVLDNLISNAIKFSPNNSKIILRVEYVKLQAKAETQQSVVCIKVIDEGSGIPENRHSDIFCKYKVVALKRDGIHQFGLGLAFCKMVVEAHRGRIFVTSNKPKGSIFTIEL